LPRASTGPAERRPHGVSSARYWSVSRSPETHTPATQGERTSSAQIASLPSGKETRIPVAVAPLPAAGVAGVATSTVVDGETSGTDSLHAAATIKARITGLIDIETCSNRLTSAPTVLSLLFIVPMATSADEGDPALHLLSRSDTAQQVAGRWSEFVFRGRLGVGFACRNGPYFGRGARQSVWGDMMVGLMNATLAPSSTAAAETGASGFRTMRRRATGLLIAAVVVYIVARSLEDSGTAWGYVRATAEAAMVGGVADWFAVTALFRHPLRIPIPHTAIIPTRKDAIGASLGSFVEENFLSPETISTRIEAAEPSARIGRWLADSDNVEYLTGRIANVAASALETFDDEQLQRAVDDIVAARLAKLDHSRGLAELIDVSRRGQHHEVLVSALCRVTIEYLNDQRATLRLLLGDKSPKWVPAILDDQVFARLHDAAVSVLTDIRIDLAHPGRRSLDRQLDTLAARLRSDEQLRGKVSVAATNLIAHPDVREFSSRMGTDLKRLAVTELTTTDSATRHTATRVVGDFGDRLLADADLQKRLDALLAKAASKATEVAGPELAALIASTVAKWDGAEAADRIEEQVGRDLQFIRINGTIVGGLVGLLIHTIGEVLL